MTMGEFVDKMIAAIDDAPELKNSTLMKIHTDAVHETEGIIIAHLFSSLNGCDYETTIAYNIPDISRKAEKIAELRKLCALMPMSTNEEFKDILDRITKINQSTVLSFATIIDVVLDYVLSGRGSVGDAVCHLEKRYNLS